MVTVYIRSETDNPQLRITFLFWVLFRLWGDILVGSGANHVSGNYFYSKQVTTIHNIRVFTHTHTDDLFGRNKKWLLE